MIQLSVVNKLKFVSYSLHNVQKSTYVICINILINCICLRVCTAGQLIGKFPSGIRTYHQNGGLPTPDPLY